MNINRFLFRELRGSETRGRSSARRLCLLLQLEPVPEPSTYDFTESKTEEFSILILRREIGSEGCPKSVKMLAKLG